MIAIKRLMQEPRPDAQSAICKDVKGAIAIKRLMPILPESAFTVYDRGCKRGNRDQVLDAISPVVMIIHCI